MDKVATSFKKKALTTKDNGGTIKCKVKEKVILERGNFNTPANGKQMNIMAGVS